MLTTGLSSLPVIRDSSLTSGVIAAAAATTCTRCRNSRRVMVMRILL
jgi:hypothetical protein